MVSSAPAAPATPVNPALEPSNGFEKQTATDENHVATVAQAVKLFLSPDLVIPPGCKIVVKRFNETEREFTYSQSGEAGVFTNHQEITLTLWEGWA